MIEKATLNAVECTDRLTEIQARTIIIQKRPQRITPSLGTDHSAGLVLVTPAKTPSPSTLRVSSSFPK